MSVAEAPVRDSVGWGLPVRVGYHGDLDKHPTHELGADRGSKWAGLRDVGRVNLVETREVVEVGKVDEA